jgi:hypothetical protein
MLSASVRIAECKHGVNESPASYRSNKAQPILLQYCKH